MTWKRVATAVVLIPCVVSLVLWGSTALVAVGIALVILLALFEYFALGEAIGHRAYRFWTATCALLLVYVQWLAAIAPSYELVGGLAFHREVGRILGILPTVQDVFFIFVLGVAALTLWTKRPVVEALPAAGISSSGLLLVAFPLSFAIRLHGHGSEGPKFLLFALVITWAGDTAAYFAGRALGKRPVRLNPRYASTPEPTRAPAGRKGGKKKQRKVARVGMALKTVGLEDIEAMAADIAAAGHVTPQSSDRTRVNLEDTQGKLF